MTWESPVGDATYGSVAIFYIRPLGSEDRDTIDLFGLPPPHETGKKDLRTPMEISFFREAILGCLA